MPRPIPRLPPVTSAARPARAPSDTTSTAPGGAVDEERTGVELLDLRPDSGRAARVDAPTRRRADVGVGVGDPKRLDPLALVVVAEVVSETVGGPRCLVPVDLDGVVGDVVHGVAVELGEESGDQPDTVRAGPLERSH